MLAKTTCPLDCFDGCSIVVGKDGTLRGDKNHPITQGYLCHHLNHYHSFQRIEKPSFNGKEISMEEALAKLIEQLKITPPEQTLFFKGSGNLGVMQSVMKLFFAQRDAIIASGSLCDEAGDVGIVEGRGANLCLSPLHVKKSEVVILWGRNPSVTNSHLLPTLKGKKLIVIDPVKIDLAQKADVHVAIKPRCDIYFALLLCRMVLIEKMEDKEFVLEHCSGFEAFKTLITAMPFEQLLYKSGCTLDDAYAILDTIKGKKVTIMVGIGVQKYSFGHSVLRSIDALGAVLGLFGKEGCGVSYLSNSGFGFASPFNVNAKTEVLPIVDFGTYGLVFIQGGNPLSQMPCTPRVEAGLQKADFVVYFGLYENETSQMANLIIPALTFLEKEDVKLSYGHEFVGLMPKVHESSIGISEYSLCQMLMKNFGFSPLRSEKEILDGIIDSHTVSKEDFLISKTYEDIPYAQGFYTNDKKFHFLESFIDDFDDEEGFYLLACKQNKSLNSQFMTDDYLYVPLHVGLNQGDKVTLSNQYGACDYTVMPSDKLRSDCVMLYSGAKNANRLTPPRATQEGNCALFQEIKVRLEK